jgi:hypothetical protein
LRGMYLEGPRFVSDFHAVNKCLVSIEGLWLFWSSKRLLVVVSSTDSVVMGMVEGCGYFP